MTLLLSLKKSLNGLFKTVCVDGDSFY